MRSNALTPYCLAILPATLLPMVYCREMIALFALTVALEYALNHCRKWRHSAHMIIHPNGVWNNIFVLNQYDVKLEPGVSPSTSPLASILYCF